MTLHDLSQLLYLRKEIAVEQRRLEELEKAVEIQQIFLPNIPNICLQRNIAGNRTMQTVNRAMHEKKHSGIQKIDFIYFTH